MRQRLGLAQALLGEPRVLLLDEPTTGLDPALRQRFYEIVEELRGRGATVLLSSHALTELEERAGRVVIMNRGDQVADGTLDELRRIARLPTRIRLQGHGAPGWRACRTGSARLTRWRRINGRMVEVDASPEAQDRAAAARHGRGRTRRGSRRGAADARRALRAISSVARRPRHEERPDRRAQGDPGGPAQPLGARHDAAAGRAGPDADLPRQRADRQRRRARARRGDREPVQPHDLPAAADRAADLARCHRRRDGARHHAAAAELPGWRAGRCCSASSSATCAILAFATLLGYGAAAGALAATGAAIDAESWRPSPP